MKSIILNCGLKSKIVWWFNYKIPLSAHFVSTAISSDDEQSCLMNS